MKVSLIAILALSWAALSQVTDSKQIRVVTTLNVLKSLTVEVGGDKVKVEALVNPKSDPHSLVARPSFKKMAAEADLFVELGLGLDIWANDVCVGSGNPKIQAGASGRILASRDIHTGELPQSLSREWGEVHPQGNPHVWLDPMNARVIAENICNALVAADAADKDYFEKRLKDFQSRLDTALFGDDLIKKAGIKKLLRLAANDTLTQYIAEKNLKDSVGGWLKKAAPLAGVCAVTYHKTYFYLANRFGFDIVGEIEEKPGIQPTQKYINELVENAKSKAVKLVLVDIYYPLDQGEILAEKIGAKVIKNSIDVEGFDEDKTYFDLIDNTLTRLLAGLSK